MAGQYYVRMYGHISGPFTADDIKRQARLGNLTTDAELSRDKANWVLATRVNGLFAPPQTSQPTRLPAAPATTVAANGNGEKLNGNSDQHGSPVSQPAEIVNGSQAHHLPPDATVTGAADASVTGPADELPAESRAEYLNKLKHATVKLKEHSAKVGSAVVGATAKSTSAIATVWNKCTELDVPQAVEEQPPPPALLNELDIFISYRRQNGTEIARFIVDRLERSGYAVFLDMNDLSRGEWAKELEQRIDQCHDFIPIITKDFFLRCQDPNDVVRKEIARALEQNKNIVPLIATDSPFPAELPEDIRRITEKNGVRYVQEYPEPMLKKLRSMLVSGRGGPERLLDDKKARRVTLVVGLILGIFAGLRNFGLYYVVLTDSFLGIPAILTNSFWAMGFAIVAIALPSFLIYSLIAAVRNIRADKQYGGRDWGLFWLAFTALVVLPASITSGTAIALAGKMTLSKSYMMAFRDGLPSWPTALSVCVAMFTAWAVSKAAIKFRIWNATGRVISLLTR